MSARIIFSAGVTLALSGCATPDADIALAEASQPFAGWAQACEKWDDWDKPGPAFQVHANTYYVGTCGIAAILITGADGHVLIDSGTQEGANVVLKNIERLGFRVEDVGLLLSSHEHFDHVGGLARIQDRSGARYFSSPEGAQSMGSGNAIPSDPQFGAIDPFDPVTIGGFAASGLPITFGGISITPIATPGHTPGAMSWQWEACEGSDCRTIVYADSLSPVSADGYRFSSYPEYIAAYRLGLQNLAALDCDVLLTPHPSASWQHERMESQTGLADSGACKRYAASIETRLNKRLAEEAAQ